MFPDCVTCCACPEVVPGPDESGSSRGRPIAMTAGFGAEATTGAASVVDCTTAGASGCCPIEAAGGGVVALLRAVDGATGKSTWKRKMWYMVMI